MSAFPVARVLEMTQRTAKLFDFVFVRIFLALGEFERFKNFLHIIERFAKCFDDMVNFVNRPLD